jgi:hypothetical protein
MNRSRIAGPAAFFGAAVFCVVGVGVLLYSQFSAPTHLFAPAPVSSNNLSTNSGKSSASAQSAPASLALFSDDRTAEQADFAASLNQRALSLIQLAPGVSDGAILAQERALPTAALPYLLADIAKAGAALLSDKLRLANAQDMQKRQDWFAANALDIFNRHAKGKAWEAPARAAMTAAIRQWSGDPRASGDEEEIIWREGGQAWELRCNDPLLFLAYAMTILDWPGEKEQAYRAATFAQQKMDARGYPPVWQLMADLTAIQAILNNAPVSDADRQQLQSLQEESQIMFATALEDRDIPRVVLLNLFSEAGAASIALNHDRRPLCAAMFDILRKSPVAPTTVLTIQGTFNTDYAWDARGDGWANSVTQNGWKLFTERLAKADAALEKAWALDSTNADAATQMLDVELGQGQGRDRMELWFKRAMEANPDNYDACWRKLYYLEPKWYGNEDEMLKFGRECVAGKNWNAGIPSILVQARLELSSYGDNTDGYPQKAYFDARPEAWDEMRAVFVERRKHRPLCLRADLSMACIASFYGKWDDVNFLLDEAKDAYDPRVISNDQLKVLRATAQAHPTTRRSEF